MSNKYETLLYINIYDNGRLRWWSNDAMGLYDKDLMNSHQGPVGAVRSQSQNSEIWGKYIYVKWMYTVNIWTVNIYIYIFIYMFMMYMYNSYNRVYIYILYIYIYTRREPSKIYKTS